MITDTDGLYINGTWVMPPDRISTNYQGNDLTKPATLQTSFSRSFSLPDNLLLRELLANAEQLDSGSRLPYQLLPAYLIDGGELIFDGVAKLTTFSRGWQIDLKEGKADLYTRMDRSIRTADLSRYDHKWSVEQMNALANATEGACYPLVDYGLLSENTMPVDALFPGMYMHTIVSQMLKEEGYVMTGSLPDDAMYKSMVLPFGESDPTANDDAWKEDRSARVTLSGNDDETGSRTIISRRDFIDRAQAYNIDDQPLNGWTQGRLGNYDTTTHEYVCDSAMRLRVQAFQTLRLTSLTGTVEAVLGVTQNGQEVDSVRIDTGSGYNLLALRTDSLEVNTLISCQAGDRIQIRLYVARQTRTGAWSATVYNNPDNSWVAFTPETTVGPNEPWLCSRNLPDVSGLQLLKSLSFWYSGDWQVNPRRREIRLNKLSDVIQNVDRARDWSTRVDTSQDIGWDTSIEPYAQRNLLKWKDSDETKKAVDGSTLAIPYGDGLITIDAPSLNAEQPLFELPFAATINSVNTLANYGNPLSIKTRTVTGSGANLSINKQSATARVILVSPDKTFEIQTQVLASDGVTFEKVFVRLKPAWFGARPTGIMNADNAFSLCFSPVDGLRGEVCLIVSNYQGLLRILRRMRKLNVGMKLYPDDISTLDFGRAIRLQGLDVDGLVIADFMGYLNKVGDYGSDGKSKVTLIAF